jgi:hypothetical protein
VGRAALVAFAAALVLVAAACGGSGEAGGDTISTTTGAPANTGGIDPMAGASTTAVTSTASAAETALMNGLAVGRHEGYDRVNFTFKNAVPGYKVAYVQPPIHEDGSGKTVAVDGSAFVEVRMEPASGFDLATGEGVLVYKGPKRISGADAGTSVVQDVVRTGDFEAVLTWTIGLSDPVDFRVLTLASPPRLAVDFRNH